MNPNRYHITRDTHTLPDETGLRLWQAQEHLRRIAQTNHHHLRSQTPNKVVIVGLNDITFEVALTEESPHA